jgi:hypothetical protein
MPVNETHQSIDSSPLVHDLVHALVFGGDISGMQLRAYEIDLQGSRLSEPPSEVP